MNNILVEGDSFESALEKGLKSLGLTIEDVDVDIVEKGQSIMDVVLRPYKLLIIPKAGSNACREENIFELKYEEDGVYLKIFTSSEKIDRDIERCISSHIDRKGLENLNNQSLLQAIHSKSDDYVKIAPAQPERQVDEEIQVSMTGDKMEAYMQLLPPLGGKTLSREDIMGLLHHYNIVYGIREDKLDELLENRRYGEEILIAEGRAPKDGIDGSIIYHIDLDKIARPLIKEDGTVDYYHLDIVENVSKGQLLATIVPPTEGRAGNTVMGNELSSRPGREVKLKVGRNTEISEDGLKLFAAIDGRVELIDEKIHVYNTLEINGDVDTSTGNIDFVGNVIINGNVLTGFQVKARGHIKVAGVVEGANLEASGDIVIRKGIQGLGKGTIRAGGKIICRFIENANVFCSGDLISEAIMHSNIQSGGQIQVAGRKGLLVGGNVRATVGIDASIIGSPMATSTTLEVGMDSALRDEHSELEIEINQVEAELEKAYKVLGLLEKLDQVGQLTDDKRLLMERVLRTQNAYREKLPRMRKRMEELEHIFNTDVGGSISVNNIMYTGVKLIIGNSNLSIREDIRRAVFVREHGEIRIKS